MLLAAGAAVDQARPDGTTPLYIACQKSHLELVSMLLAVSTPLDQPRPGSATLLHIACQNGHLWRWHLCCAGCRCYRSVMWLFYATLHRLPLQWDRGSSAPVQIPCCT